MDFVSIIGYGATVFYGIAFASKSILRSKIFRAIGFLCLALYGVFVSAWPVIALSVLFLLVDLVFVVKLLNSKKHAFEMLRCSKNDLLLGKFVKYNEKDIRKFMPKFDWKKISDDAVCFYLMRNMELAGVWISNVRDSYTYEVNLDYVTEKYRDLKSGEFIYGKNKELLLNIGIRFLTSDRHSDAHCKYLEALGFEYREKDRLYKLKL
ncbi:MAG: hypothetical protein WCV63_02440 [Negativicutes bacterium]|jgi:hypothetical protein